MLRLLAMLGSVLSHLAASLLIVPAALVPWRRDPARDALFWGTLGLATLVAVGWAAAQVEPRWSAGFATAIWLTVALTLIGFVVLALVAGELWRLAGLLLPYLVVLTWLAVAWSQEPAQAASLVVSPAWLGLHVLLSLATYVLLTLAAVSGAAVFLQERALKRRRPTRVTRALPSLADAEALEYRLLGACALVLAAGIATGMGAQYAADGSLLAFNHKTVLTLAAFSVIALLLLARRLWGVRGRRGARYVLIGYLLLTLAYPGVKFVTDVILA